MLSPRDARRVKPILDALLHDQGIIAERGDDPVEFTWRYEAPRDREFVALLSSCLAYGRVALLKEAIAHVLDILGPRPADAMERLGAEAIFADLADFKYRMTSGSDVGDLIVAASRLQADFGSIEAAYAAPIPEMSAPTHLDRASHLVQQLRARRHSSGATRGFRYLLPDPADGSTCKRLHLFFRWMVRGPDAVDLGIWKVLSPRDLIMPLDTHTGRFCRYLGLTERKSTDQKTALEVTQSLAMLDAADPLKYDFALCHLGISGRCIHEYSPAHCPDCPIRAVCALARR